MSVFVTTAQRCDDTVGKKRVNSCVLKLLFLDRLEQPKKLPGKTGNALSDALLMSCFQIFAADAAKKKPASRGFNELINSNEFGAKHSEKLFPSLNALTALVLLQKARRMVL